MTSWLYDEFKHCGVDYSKAELAKKYDGQHLKFRDYAKEFKSMMDFLEIRNPETKSVIDFGCGTGATARYAADVFKQVYAIDVSEAMIEQAKAAVGQAAHANLFFIHAGFLTYRHSAPPVDLVITKAAFHHLPDFWKQVALWRMNALLTAGGLFYLHDVVFHFEPQQLVSATDAWISQLEAHAGPSFRPEIETHIRDEHSTFDWILRGMLDRAGFQVEKARTADGFVTEYACRKVRAQPYEDPA